MKPQEEENMLEGVEEKLSYAAAEADWDDAAKIMVLASFISDEVRRDRVVLERFHAFLDEWVSDELGENDLDEDDVNPEDGLTDADRQAAYEATGFGPDDMGDDQIMCHVSQHEEDPLYVMEETLRDKEKIFEYTGGRGIELADEIDALRIAIAIRRARGET